MKRTPLKRGKPLKRGGPLRVKSRLGRATPIRQRNPKRKAQAWQRDFGPHALWVTDYFPCLASWRPGDFVRLGLPVPDRWVPARDCWTPKPSGTPDAMHAIPKGRPGSGPHVILPGCRRHHQEQEKRLVWRGLTQEDQIRIAEVLWDLDPERDR